MGILVLPDGGKECGHCGKVYNQFLGMRFWSGTFPCDVETCDDDVHYTLCDNHHRELVRE